MTRAHNSDGLRRTSLEGVRLALPGAEEAVEQADARQSLLRGALARLHPLRMPLFACGHMLVFVFVYWLAFEFRFDFQTWPETYRVLFWQTLPCLLGIKFVAFYLNGQYHGWWRYVTFSDLVSLLKAAMLSLIAFAALDAFVVWSRFTPNVPRQILMLDPLLTVVILGSIRATWRLFSEQLGPIFHRNSVSNALVVGVDHSTAMLAYQLQSHLALPFRIRGFLTIETDRARTGSRLGNIPILGDLDELAEIAAAYRISDILVMAGALPGLRMRKLMDDCRSLGLRLKVLRPLEEFVKGDLKIPTRDIEITDLLRRDPVQLDNESIGRLLAGKRVMVTGAGGSIGSEICRQVAKFHPAAILLVGRGENRIFAIERELQTIASELQISLKTAIGDVADRQRMAHVFAQFRPEVVFHAAAHKHVPLMENNVGEAIKNNVFGTKCVAELADQSGVEAFVMISTDKAVHPTSVMGVSKQLAERYIYAMSQESATRFVVVRFGNVLGSNGSVVPIFQEQIRNGGPITVTDPRMTRFFMTIPEASQLVLQSAAMGRGGEIFVLEMGEPVKIVDLAKDLIRLSGLPEHAVEIVFTGVRPGEKLFEELYFTEEQTLPTSHPKVRAAYHRPYSLAEVRQSMGDLESVLHGSSAELRTKLKAIVPEFQPFCARTKASDPFPAAVSVKPCA